MLRLTEIAFLRSLPESELKGYLDDLDAETSQAIRDSLEYLMSRDELADFFAIAVDTIDLWKRKGCPYEGGQGQPSQYNLQKVARWLVGRKQVVLGDDYKERLDTLLREEKLKLAELQRQKEECVVVEIERVEQLFVETADVLRDQFDRIYPHLPEDIAELIFESISSARTKFYKRLPEIVGAGYRSSVQRISAPKDTDAA